MAAQIVRPAAWLARFRRDRRGVAALEFALIAPLLILLFVGVNELSQAMIVQRKVSHTASAIGDLTAQVATVSKSDVDAIFAAGTATMAPYEGTGLNLTLTSITADKDAKAQIDWSRNSTASGGAGRTTLDSDFPKELVAVKGDTVIMAEATYTYNSPFNLVVSMANKEKFKSVKGLVLSESFYLRPRRIKVVCSDCK